MVLCRWRRGTVFLKNESRRETLCESLGGKLQTLKYELAKYKS